VKISNNKLFFGAIALMLLFSILALEYKVFVYFGLTILGLFAFVFWKERAISEIRGKERSEKMFRNLIESMPDSILIVNEKGRIVFINQKTERQFGYGRNDLIGKPVEILMPEEHWLSHIHHMRLIGNETGEILVGAGMELTATKKGGGIFPAEIHLSSLQTEAGLFVSVSVRDISDRIKSEAMLKKSEENFRMLLSNVDDYAIFMVDINGLVASWNSGAEHIKGYSADEIIGRPIEVFYSEEDIKRGEPRFNLEMAREHGRYEKEGWRVRKDGSRFFADVIFTALVDENGNLQGYSKVIRDITERKKAQKKLEFLSLQIERSNDAKEQCYVSNEDYYEPLDLWQENHIYPSADVLSVYIRDITEKKKAEQQKEFDNNNLSALINNTEDLMWSVDKNLKLITFNNAFNRTVRLSSGVSLVKGGDILSTQFTEEQLARYKIFYARALSGETFTFIDHFDHPVEFWSEISFYPIRRADIVIGTACFSRNITARMKAEKALLAMEQEIMSQKVQEQKKITRAVINAQEKERNHLGQELHDNISQILVSAKIFLGSTVNKNEQIRELIKFPLELIDNSIQEIRSLSSRHVTPLKEIDLEELVTTQLHKLSENTAIKTSFEYYVPEGYINDDLKLNIYRIIQEQTNNILKYANAENVDISIRTDRNTLEIVTTDDGKGFDVHSKRNGIGISNMMNRIESFNGKMIIQSALDQGCKIQVIIPY
jgi:PAS domain S-box-containing protein